MPLHVSSPSCPMCTDNTMHKSQTHKSCVLRTSPCKGSPQYRAICCCLYLPEAMRNPYTYRFGPLCGPRRTDVVLLMKSCRRLYQHPGVEDSMWRSKPRAECIRDRVCVGLRGWKEYKLQIHFTVCHLLSCTPPLFSPVQHPCCLEKTN